MNNYYNNLNPEIKKYFEILSPIFPEWLFEYIDTPEMDRIGKISMSCGTDYSKFFDVKYFYSNLDHSVAVALIIWNFTHDKNQTLAGLFHDIATPAFKHCIDFMNGDSLTQESTEERTLEILRNSNKIMKLLKRDGIEFEEVCDYKIYPIADNDTPKLSSDRFEYNFSSGLTYFRVWELDEIKEIYNNVTISNNEDNIPELVFKDKHICEKYIHTISKLWAEWISDKDKIVMQFIADTCKYMKLRGYLTIDDLYTLSEQKIIEKIINSEDSYLSEHFKKFMNTDKVYYSDKQIQDKYCININAKKRYIVPLVITQNGNIRINKVSESANSEINEFLNISNNNWTYFDFDFNPYLVDKQKVLKK